MNPKDIKIFSLDTLLGIEFPPSDTMLGENLLDKGGALLISGPQKIGKSLFATQLALSIASRQEFLGFAVGQNDYRVLILQAEVSLHRMQQRFAKQVLAYPEEARKRILNACVYSSLKLDSADGIATVTAWVDQLKPDLVIVDPLANFHTGDENVAQDMSRVTSALDEIRARGVSVVLVHHHGKSSTNNLNVGHKARGSSVLPGWYDSHLSLEWAVFQKSVRLRFELRHDEVPGDRVLNLNPNALLFEAGNDEVSQISLVVAAIRELGSADAETVGAHCSMTRQWANNWLNSAVEAQKLVRQDGRPVIYGLPGQLAETRVDVSADQVVVTTNTGAAPLHMMRNGEDLALHQ